MVTIESLQKLDITLSYGIIADPHDVRFSYNTSVSSVTDRQTTDDTSYQGSTASMVGQNCAPSKI